MYSARRTASLPAVGFPIRTSPDQSLVSGSPPLFAAAHVLLRLLSPRHPSCALCSLVISLPSSFVLLFEKTRVQRGSVVNRIFLAEPTHFIAYLRICSFQRPCSVSQNQTASPRDCETAFDLVLLPAVAGRRSSLERRGSRR